MIKTWFLDGQMGKLSPQAKNELRDLWRDNELGNDNFMLSMSINDLLEYEDKYRNLILHIQKCGVPDEEQVILHFWW